MKRWTHHTSILTALIAAAAYYACATRPGAPGPNFALRPGDLLFQDLDGSPLCDAIETVTQGVDGARFSHVGVVASVNGGEAMVLEAVSRGVVLTPLPAFLDRSRDADGRPKVLVGRLRPRYRPLIPEAIDAGRALLGRPYDGVFIVGDDAYYCSELVHEMFRAADPARPLFGLEPMTFRDPETAQTLPTWSDYYAGLQRAIPEGELGINPGAVSRSSALRIVHAYGRPAGWRPRP